MITIFGVVFTTQLQMALLPDVEAPMAVVSTQDGRQIGALLMSAWNCIRKSFLQAPPSTFRELSL